MSLSTDGLIFYYGNFNHRIGECYPRSVSLKAVMTRDRVRWANVYTMEIAGDLVSEDGGPLTQAEVKSRIELMDAAYSEDYKDCGFKRADNTLTPHVMATAGASNLSGNQVVSRSWDNSLPTEYANTRSFSIVISSLQLANEGSSILEFSEQVVKRGTGGPLWRKFNLWDGSPLKVQLAASSKVLYVQSGRIVGLTGWEPIPDPLWNVNNEQQWRRIISSASPVHHGFPGYTKGTHYLKTYQYFFELSAAEDKDPSPWPTGP